MVWSKEDWFGENEWLEGDNNFMDIIIRALAGTSLFYMLNKVYTISQSDRIIWAAAVILGLYLGLWMIKPIIYWFIKVCVQIHKILCTLGREVYQLNQKINNTKNEEKKLKLREERNANLLLLIFVLVMIIMIIYGLVK